VRLGKDIVVRTLLYRPANLQPLWNGKDLTGWKRIDSSRLPVAKRPGWQVANGVLSVKGGPGALQFQGRPFADVLVQLRARTGARHSNGGLFIRCIPDDLMNSYEAQLYNRCEDGDPAKPSRYSTGAIDDRQNARHLVSRDGVPFVLTVLAHGNHLATWVNGYQVTDWTDTRPKHSNPRQGLRLEAGTLQLQAHDPATDYEVLALCAVHLE
jgi:hypothetical protein